MPTAKGTMKNKLVAPLALTLLFALNSQLSTVRAQGTAFTYQGQLQNNGSPANGSYDLTFTLYNASSGGIGLFGPLTNSATAVTNGLFTTTLDFGSNAFGGAPWWLQIGVRTNGGASFATLTPRQQLTPTPYAIYSSGAGTATTANGVSADSVTGAGIASGQVVKSLNGLADAVTLAAGANVTITPSGNTLMVASTGGGGNDWSLTGNSGTTYGTDFLGTSDNEPLELKVNGVVAETLWPFTSGNVSVALGPNSFFGTSGQGGSFVGPGGGPGYGSAANITYGDYCVIGGGYGNQITVLGSVYSVIAGGDNNILSGECAVISGGFNNTNAGEYATIPGGANNSVSSAGTYGFAAGDNATVTNTGSFVWSDGTGTLTASTANNSVTFRASGGYRLFSDTGAAGVQLAPGGGAWTSLSDRNAKKNFQPVDAVAVLEKLAAIPIEQWNYKWEKDTDVPNIGPMAQDFKKAFYPGRDDKGISTLEFDGVELAAIQGLNQKLEQKETEITDLKARLEKLEQMMSEKNEGAK
jgi:hypothetical protein